MHGTDFEEDDEEPEVAADSSWDEAPEGADLGDTEELLAHATQSLRELARRLEKDLRDQLDVKTEEDGRVADELFEDELDNLLRDEEDFHQVADALMEAIERRFDLLPCGEVPKDAPGLAPFVEWPMAGGEPYRVSRGNLVFSPATTRLVSGAC